MALAEFVGRLVGAGSHRVSLVAGFAATNALVVAGWTAVPFWPIWWSQTGLWEGGLVSWGVFAATALLTGMRFARRLLGAHRLAELALLVRRLELRRFIEAVLLLPRVDALGLAGAACFAGMGLINSNMQPFRALHNALALVSGLLVVAHLVGRRVGQRREASAAIVALLFAALLVIETVPKRAVPWEPARTLWTPEAVASLQRSAIAQWAQLALFLLLS